MIRRNLYTFFLSINYGFLFSILNSTPSFAEILPDSSAIGTKVIQEGKTHVITGGSRSGSNLFHSFKKFSIPNGNTAFLKNSLDIQNILIRVTGSSASNINGIFKTNGKANLFLLNPNGIFFGPNASLDVGGSFLASTANSIKFADGSSFDVKISGAEPILTVDVPIGLGFLDTPKSIQVSGDGEGTRKSLDLIDTNAGLRVQPDKTLALVGGSLVFKGATLKTAGGRIELGSVASSGMVKLDPSNKGWILKYSQFPVFGDIYLSESATVDASGKGGGDIQIQGKNLNLESGSQIETSTLRAESGGVLKINVSDSVNLIGSSQLQSSSNTSISSLVYPKATGDGGELEIKARQLNIRDGATIAAGTYGSGNASSVKILASDEVILSRKPTRRGGSSISSSGYRRSTGNGGDINIQTRRLILRSGGILSSGSFGEGVGGEISLKASEEVQVTGVSLTGNSPSRISTRTVGRGNAGGVSIKTKKLTLSDGGRVIVGGEKTASFVTSIKPGKGNAGSLRVEASSIELDKGKISSATARTAGKGTEGEGGNIFLKSDDLRSRSGEITTSAGGTGNGGDITINAETIAALEGTKIRANAFEGNGGNIKIRATGLFVSPDSTITATSEKGLDGTIDIDTVESNFDSAIVIPKEKIDIPEMPLLCGVNADGEIEPEKELEIFTSRNRPPMPSDLMESRVGWHDTSSGEVNNFVKPIKTEPVEKYVEAQGAVWNPDGTIRLVVDPIDDVPFSRLKNCLRSYSELGASKDQRKNYKNKSGLDFKGDSVKFKVKRFRFKGNKVFSDKELQKIVAPHLEREISFKGLIEARTAIAKFYVERGYITSGALIPVDENQKIKAEEGTFTIQIVEGGVEGIKISGSSRLRRYIKARLDKATSPALNKNRLVKSLQLLQLDPLIEKISAEISEGSRLGQSFLIVRVKPHQAITLETGGDNWRSPTIGRFQRGFGIYHGNLLGLGDRLGFKYRNTDGSDIYSGIYSVPVNSRNGRIELSYTDISSKIVERPFSRYDILGDARAYNLTFRQPLFQKVSESSISEFALGINASRQENKSSLLGEAYPLSRGADENGRTKISALRFFQDWTRRGEREAFSLRSQFSLGVGAFDATINKSEPDSRFFAWLGQAAWRTELGSSDTSLLIKGALQIADRPIVALERFGLGGATSVRGYRQDTFFTDNGLFLSGELRVPVLKIKKSKFYVIPFVDFGTAWNNDSVELAEISQQEEGALASLGLGVEYDLGGKFNARIDWGVPLISVDNSNSNSWKEEGLYFSVRYKPF